VGAHVHFIARVLGFEEVHQFINVGGSPHPLGRVRGAVMLRQTQFLETPVGHVLNILVHVFGIEP
jgi:hypothetical protein